MESKGFESYLIHIGDVVPGGTIEGKFIYNGPSSDIERIQTACGSCTTVGEMEDKDGKTHINFSYLDDHNPDDRIWRIPGNTIAVQKKMTVYFKDGKPETIEKKGETFRNPDKEFDILKYDVYVKK